jgi:hypothetical protein
LSFVADGWRLGWLEPVPGFASDPKEGVTETWRPYLNCRCQIHSEPGTHLPSHLPHICSTSISGCVCPWHLPSNKTCVIVIVLGDRRQSRALWWAW